MARPLLRPTLAAALLAACLALPGAARAEEHAPAKKPSAQEHVQDSTDWHLFDSIPGLQHVHLPKIFGFQITKFEILELIAAGLVIAIYVPLARRMQSGAPPRGAWDNAFESLLTFVRNEIAKPNLGEHDADRFVPFLWTLFLFILFNNLLGIVPFGGSATASIYVTGALALCVFFAIHGSAVAKMGLRHYLRSMWPAIDLPQPAGFVVQLLVFVIELVGVLVRNFVLAIRLFANMFAGHMVLATILLFIQLAGLARVHPLVWSTVTLGSVLGLLALSLLELFIAFLQAYIFTFLASLFVGLAIHPEH